MPAMNRGVVCMPDDLRQWVEAEAARLDRPLAWIVKYALKAAKEQIQAIPAADAGLE